MNDHHWLTSFLELTEGQRLPHLQAWAYWHLGCIIYAVLTGTTRQHQLQRCFERSLALLREAEDRQGEALSLAIVAFLTHIRGDRDLEGNPVKNVLRMADEKINETLSLTDHYHLAEQIHYLFDVPGIEFINSER